MTYYTIYQTTNLITNKIYIGLHVTKNPMDSYLGSGIFITKSIKKYGKENFKKDILFIYDNKEDMIKKEIEIVNSEFVKSSHTYNMSMGGYGLSTLTDDKKIETLKKMREAQNNMSAEDIKKKSDKRKNTILSKDPDAFKKIGKKSGNTQKKMYENGFISPVRIETIVEIYNDMNEIMYKFPRYQLKEMCEKYNLPLRVLDISLKNKGIPLYLKQMSINEKFHKYKGWYAIYENDIRMNLENYVSTIKKPKEKVIFIKPTYEIYKDNIKVFTFSNYHIGIKDELQKNNLPYNSLLKTLKENRPIKAGTRKGYYMKKL